MQMTKPVVISAFLLFSAYSSANVHPEVQEALDYQVPLSECGEEPVLRGVNTFRDTAEKAAQSDIDHYTRERHERRHKRWSTCNDKYRDVLMNDFSRLKDSARHGMTQAQAEVVLGHMKSIQDVLRPPEVRE